MKRSTMTMLILFLAASAATFDAQGRGGQAQVAPSDADAHAIPTNGVAALPDKISQTSHTVRLDGREIRYTATVGTLPISLDDGKVAARIFFVAYTKDGEDAK